MEITKPDAVNEELLAKSQTRSLDELRRKGKDKVKVIRASDVTAMISETVNRVLRESSALSDEDVETLVQKGTKEFKRVFRERQLERQRAAQELQDLQAELQAANTRIKELEGVIDTSVDRRASREEQNSELMMRMVTEMAEIKAEIAKTQEAAQGSQPSAAAAPETDGVSKALDQISASLNSRLEQFGKKMGISSAVEARDVKYESLFDSDDDANMESNMGDVELKQNTGGGIAGNLARLKKLKGDG